MIRFVVILFIAGCLPKGMANPGSQGACYEQCDVNRNTCVAFTHVRSTTDEDCFTQWRFCTERCER